MERGARGGAHAEAAHQRLGAVVAGADADRLAVAELGDVVRVDALDRERDDPAAAVEVGRPEERDAVDLGQPLERVGGQLALVRAHVLHAERRQVLDRRAEPHRLVAAEVPASNLKGSSFQVERSRSTREIMWPPPRNGRIPSSSSRRPCSMPIVGPRALWPVQA